MPASRVSQLRRTCLLQHPDKGQQLYWPPVPETVTHGRDKGNSSDELRISRSGLLDRSCRPLKATSTSGRNPRLWTVPRHSPTQRQRPRLHVDRRRRSIRRIVLSSLCTLARSDNTRCRMCLWFVCPHGSVTGHACPCCRAVTLTS